MPSSIITPRLAFVLVSMALGQLGDGLNIFQGIYLVTYSGWNEGSVGAALSLMGLTALIIQPFAGDWVDKATKIDRRLFLCVASIVTAMSASTILLVKNHANTGHMLIYSSKVCEGIASSFIGPCLAALTLACFGPKNFDTVMASNIFWGHVGSVVAAILAGLVAYIYYPDNIKYCFLVIGASALFAIFFVQYLPQGDPLMGRGFATTNEKIMNEDGTVDAIQTAPSSESDDTAESDEMSTLINNGSDDNTKPEKKSSSDPTASSYLEVFLDFKTCVLCLTGFFFHFANANVLLVLGELMGTASTSSTDTSAATTFDDDMTTFTSTTTSNVVSPTTTTAQASPEISRTAIPLTAMAIVTAQLIMSVATIVGGRCTERGIGRKPLFMAAIACLPIRCALIIFFDSINAGHFFLLSTQIMDGISGGLFGLIHPYLVADITFGTGRFNVIMGVTASCFGLGATLSNYLGQLVVQEFGHIASLTGSLIISIIPIVLFSFMPETYGHRGAAAGTSAGNYQATKKNNNSGSPSEYQTFSVEA